MNNPTNHEFDHNLTIIGESKLVLILNMEFHRSSVLTLLVLGKSSMFIYIDLIFLQCSCPKPVFQMNSKFLQIRLSNVLAILLLVQFFVVTFHYCSNRSSTLVLLLVVQVIGAAMLHGTRAGGDW
jgi:hypothetical protein